MPKYSNEGFETCEFLGTETITNHGVIDIYYCESSTPYPTMVAKSSNDPKVVTSIPIPILLNDTPAGFPPITNILKQYYFELNQNK